MSSDSPRNEVSIMFSSGGEAQGTKKASSYVPGEKSGKWSDEEHMKYIIFIDYNKEKMRSKEKRRSNKFYEEMAHFISTRNSLQCRSHHQKLEEKYTHVNKIIALYKGHFNKGHYKTHIEHLDALTHEKHIEGLTKHSLHERTTVDKAMQTDIQDVRCDLVAVSPNIVVIQDKRDAPVNVQVPPTSSHSFYPPPMYSPMEASRHTSPSLSPFNQMGWWNGYPPSRF